MNTLVPESEIPCLLSKIPAWKHEGSEISRQFQFRDFAAAMVFVNAVAEKAEAANHHPDIDIRWNKVLLRLSTHSKGGLTESDFALAEQIDRLD